MNYDRFIFRQELLEHVNSGIFHLYLKEYFVGRGRTNGTENHEREAFAHAALKISWYSGRGTNILPLLTGDVLFTSVNCISACTRIMLDIPCVVNLQGELPFRSGSLCGAVVFLGAFNNDDMGFLVGVSERLTHHYYFVLFDNSVLPFAYHLTEEHKIPHSISLDHSC